MAFPPSPSLQTLIKQLIDLLTSGTLNVKTADDSAPISGAVSVTNFPASQNVAVTSVPLAAGAATSSNQSTGNSSLSSIDGKITAVNTGAVVISSSALPSGASTSSLQTTGNTSIASVDTKTPSLGQTTMSGSTPVVIASNQSAIPVSGTVTVSSVAVSNFPATQAISASSLPLPIGAATSALQTQPGVDIGDVTINNASGVSAVNVQDGGNSLTVDGTVGATQSGTWNITNVSGTVSLPTGAATAVKQPALGIAGIASSDVLSVQGIASMTSLKVDGSGVTHPISAASLPLPTGASTSTLQTTGNTSLSSLDTKTPSLGQAAMASSSPVVIASNQSAIPVSQSGTWTIQPGNTANTTAWKVDGSAVTQPVSGTITANAGTGTFAISAVSLPLPSGASTAAKQPTLGIAGTASSDVLTIQGIASMTAVKTDGSGVTQPISAAALPLPSGASTTAKQPALGTAGTASSDVITVQGIASMTALKVDGSAITQPVSASSLPLPTGASTAAKQPALGTAGSSSSDVLSIQGIASMVALKVDGSAVTQPVNYIQIGGNSVSTGNGVVGTGVQRVAISSDNTAFSVNATLQTGANTIGALTANQSVNLNQAAGNTLVTGNGVTGTGSPRVTIASDNSPVPIILSSPTKTTYSATVNNLTPPATPTDIVIINGSGTKTVKVLRIELDATQSATATNTFFLVKRSSANTGGTSANATLVPHDSGNAAATAVVKSYTANAASLGAAVGNVRVSKVLTPLATTATSNPLMVWDFDSNNTGQPIVLRGTAEGLALNFNGAALPSGLNITCNVTFSEE